MKKCLLVKKMLIDYISLMIKKENNEVLKIYGYEIFLENLFYLRIVYDTYRTMIIFITKREIK